MKIQKKFSNFELDFSSEKRKIYLTFHFLQFGKKKKFTRTKKQPTTLYKDWINNQYTKMYHCTLFCTNS